MARNNFLILDSDLHMMEPDDLWARWLDEPYRQNPPRFFGGQREQLKKAGDDKGNANSIMGMEVQGLQIPAHNMQQGATVSSRELRRRSRARHPHFQVARARGYDAVSTLTAMDIEGIDVAVMYGTRGRQILCHDDLEAGLCRGAGARLQQLGRRLLQDRPDAAQIRRADRDARRRSWRSRRRGAASRELGAVAVIGTPNPVNGQHLHDEAVEPLWDALEELDVPIGFHPTGNTSLKDDAGRRYVGHANFHPIAHAIRNPVELMGAIASLTTGGVMERHPKLRAAFLEGTAGWLPWWLWRLDDQWEKFGPGCENPLSMLPSEYFKRQCYIALDVDEEPAVHAVNDLGADYFVVSSDYPHSDGAFPEAIGQFLGLPLNDEQRRKILWDNCARLYGIPTPSGSLTREQQQVSAAE